MVEKRKENLYERAGILDVAEFYRTRFVSEQLRDPRFFAAVNRFDIRWSRTMWVYDNVRRGATVLDLGCGEGVLALLKRKGVRLAGVDINAQCTERARRNGYDRAVVASLDALPFAPASFDYVVSLDVLGHVAFEEKDAVLREIKRVLRPDGVTLHGIECLDRARRKDYDEMTDEELRRYVEIDGHVGMEDETGNAARFARFFAHVATAPRFSICQSYDEFLKQSDTYGRDYCEPDFLAYLRHMSFRERRAFDMAMGYVFDKISEAGLRLPPSEYLFLKAAALPLGPFYNEHRDRSDLLLPEAITTVASKAVVLDASPLAAFDDGWYEAECFPPIARWMAERAAISFRFPSLSIIRLQLQTHLPRIEEEPLRLKFYLNGIEAGALRLDRYGWVEVEMDASEIAARLRKVTDEPFELELRANRVWQPSHADAS
ncbi:MAG TPA: class I SAM-dependent methyltransferase, partial [Pyrinomonadaceae bacterium]